MTAFTNIMFGRDSRRIQGPLESQPIALFSKPKDKNEALHSLIDEEQSRIDGRRLDEIRPLYLRTGVVTQAKGSSYFESIGAKVVCAVYGPRESQRRIEFSTKGKLVCEVTFAPFSQKIRQQSTHGVKAKNISSLIETSLSCAVCLESFPKSQMDIYINVLQGSGDVLSASIVAASIALADAGIEMYDLVSACSVSFDKYNFALDPSIEELNPNTSAGSLTIGYLPSLNIISCLTQSGKIDADANSVGIKTCLEGCIRIHKVMQDCLVAGVERKKQQLVLDHKYS